MDKVLQQLIKLCYLTKHQSSLLIISGWCEVATFHQLVFHALL